MDSLLFMKLLGASFLPVDLVAKVDRAETSSRRTFKRRSDDSDMRRRGDVPKT
jgi:hypothetical protein